MRLPVGGADTSVKPKNPPEKKSIQRTFSLQELGAPGMVSKTNRWGRAKTKVQAFVNLKASPDKNLFSTKALLPSIGSSIQEEDTPPPGRRERRPSSVLPKITEIKKDNENNKEQNSDATLPKELKRSEAENRKSDQTGIQRQDELNQTGLTDDNCNVCDEQDSPLEADLAIMAVLEANQTKSRKNVNRKKQHKEMNRETKEEVPGEGLEEKTKKEEKQKKKEKQKKDKDDETIKIELPMPE